MLPTVTATITMHPLHRPNAGKEKVSLTTTLITKLLTDPLAKSRSRDRTRVTNRQPQGRSASQADCRWHGRGQGFESPKLHGL